MTGLYPFPARVRPLRSHNLCLIPSPSHTVLLDERLRSALELVLRRKSYIVRHNPLNVDACVSTPHLMHMSTVRVSYSSLMVSDSDIIKEKLANLWTSCPSFYPSSYPS